uniref:Uncharacterized protein n=1 Tax=Fagus sylvatica TaxID=28930 RepID=A0A2N9FVH9_FAGSY
MAHSLVHPIQYGVPSSLNLNANHHFGSLNGGPSMALKQKSSQILCGIQFLLLKKIKDNILIRNHTVKWWDNYDRDRIIKFVYDEFPEIEEVEDHPWLKRFPSAKDFLKGNPLRSLQKFAEVCCPSPACQAASASASGTKENLQQNLQHPQKDQPLKWFTFPSSQFQ